MANQRRVYRVAEKIRSVIALNLLRLADPRFFLVTITSVVVSPDLRHAKVYWMATGGKERIPEVMEAFDHAEGHFRVAVAKELRTRFSPELRFYYDDTLDTQDQVERLLEQVSRKSQSQE